MPVSKWHPAMTLTQKLAMIQVIDSEGRGWLDEEQQLQKMP
jgi:hypothetical protein